ncbi:probable Cytochrome c oxidase assembly protein COX15 [Saccharomycodes ludwigii]|uniref:Probable Cytochrome c oxidase assembly protein COX15 n=1 Tax=Saccharomycodes ludwigii TaxID=36035 RepID=A0A376BAY5_9ASCO|nr:probable Cytochrome c oxidase assembly protein COX15 [Saccharomycodes ludwigii]
MFRNVVTLKQGLKTFSRLSQKRQSVKFAKPTSLVSTITRKININNPFSPIRQFSQAFKRSITTTTTTATTGSTTAPVKKVLINSNKYVGYWLVGTSGLVFGIVILGGLTRLTESGLSITEWKPVTGAIPPLNQKQWEEEFTKYKESPEFKQLNSHIDLDEFKFIFFMEWGHRLWGRGIGLIFILPAIYFTATRKTSSHVNRRLLGLCGLLGLQGFVGWWMVKSGLDQQQLDERKSKPTVSQYRLTAHLGAAFILYMGMLWTGWEIIRESKWVKNPENALQLFKQLDNPALKPLRKMALGMVVLTFITAMTGGMVAGLDAGLMYNTFPRMGDDWLPSNRELLDPFYARKEDKSDLFWRNILENPTTVQLNHRIFAITTFFAVFGFHMYASRNKHIIPRHINRSIHLMMGIVTLQFALGISTLVYMVPISLASAHQAGALALLTISLLCASQLRQPRIPMRLLIGNLYKKQILEQQQQLARGSKILNEVSKLAK